MTPSTDNTKEISVFQAYLKEIDEKLRCESGSYSSNKDRLHNAAIVYKMLESAKEVNMFCGEMSVFRKSFYDKIEQDATAEVASEARDKVATALKTFLSKDGHRLNIVFEKFSSTYLDDMIIAPEIWRQACHEERVTQRVLFKTLVTRSDINHFSVTDDKRLYRMELNKKAHQAILAINQTDKGSTALEIFSRLQELSFCVKA